MDTYLRDSVIHSILRLPGHGAIVEAAVRAERKTKDGSPMTLMETSGVLHGNYDIQIMTAFGESVGIHETDPDKLTDAVAGYLYEAGALNFIKNSAYNGAIGNTLADISAAKSGDAGRGLQALGRATDIISAASKGTDRAYAERAEQLRQRAAASKALAEQRRLEAAQKQAARENSTNETVGSAIGDHLKDGAKYVGKSAADKYISGLADLGVRKTAEVGSYMFTKAKFKFNDWKAANEAKRKREQIELQQKQLREQQALQHKQDAEARREDAKGSTNV